MSRPGTPPKRSEERRRTNSPEPEKVDVSEVPGADDPGSLPFKIAQPIVVPEFDGVWESPLTDDGDRITAFSEPKPNEPWPPLAQQLWDSFSSSGQALYWQPSDWMIAAVVVEKIARDLRPQIIGYEETSDFENGVEISKSKIPIWGEAPIKGADLAALMKAAGALMLVEGERRKLLLELTSRYEAPKPKTGGNVVGIRSSRKALLAGGAGS